MISPSLYVYLIVCTLVLQPLCTSYVKEASCSRLHEDLWRTEAQFEDGC